MDQHFIFSGSVVAFLLLAKGDLPAYGLNNDRVGGSVWIQWKSGDSVNVVIGFTFL